MTKKRSGVLQFILEGVCRSRRTQAIHVILQFVKTTYASTIGNVGLVEPM